MVQRGYRTLVLWIVWAAAAIVIYASMYNDTEVIQFIEHDNTHITWAILMLFFMGVFTSFILTVVLTLESVRVDRLEVIAKERGWMGIQSTSKFLCIARFFESLAIIVRANGDLNIEALVDVEFAIYRRSAHALEVIGNLLITLGLVGTVVGLTLTLTGLTGSLEALGHDEELLLRGLRNAMGGMGTAFYTTLLGSVLGGVLLRVFAHIDENGVDVLENALTRICLVYVSADLKPSEQRDIHTLNAELDKLTQRMNQLQQVLSATKTDVKEFTHDMAKLLHHEKEITSLEKLLSLRKQYLDSLRDEFQLERLNKSLIWRAILRGFRRN